MEPGRLVAFEGPDGVGKSDLVARFHTWLEEEGYTADLLSFPGKEEGHWASWSTSFKPCTI